MRTIHYVGFMLFFIVYGYFKYTAVPQQMGQAAYIVTTGVVLLLTAIIPFFASHFAIRNMTSNMRYVIAGVLPLTLCGIGLATYFFVFIAPNAPGISVMQVLPRAIVPGLVMGVLLLLPLFMRKT